MTLRAAGGVQASSSLKMRNATTDAKVFWMPQRSLRGRIKEFSAKSVIYHEGDCADFALLIRTGLVKMLSYLPNGRVRIVRLHARGHWLGLEGLIGRRFEHTAMSIGDVEVESDPICKLRHLEVEEPQQYFELLRQCYLYLGQADMWIAEFSTGEIKPRVARLVSFLSVLEHGESSNLVELLTVHEISDILGVTPESVSRILAEFKRSNVLRRLDDDHPSVYEINALKLNAEIER